MGKASPGAHRMPEDDAHDRLESLNREPLDRPPAPEPPESLRERVRKGLRRRRNAAAPTAGEAAAPGPEPLVFRRDMPRRPPPRRPIPAVGGPFVPVADAIDGQEVTAPDGQPAYVVDRPLRAAGSPWTVLCDGFLDALASPASGLRAELVRMGVPQRVGVADVLFLDLETAGLGSAPLFLVGAMVWEGTGLVVRQFFARDYSEEAAALELFLALARPRTLLMSFNGKSFDLPFVRMRAAASGVAWDWEPAHLDLLHASRRVWGPTLSDCRLQTLERVLCGRLRDDDIPGHLIPDAYHEFVRTGNAVRMASVLEHNFLDLVTLADLLTRLPAGTPVSDE